MHFNPGVRLISQALVVHSNCNVRVLRFEMHLGSFGRLVWAKDITESFLYRTLTCRQELPKLLFAIPWLANVRLAPKLKGTLGKVTALLD